MSLAIEPELSDGVTGLAQTQRRMAAFVMNPLTPTSGSAKHLENGELMQPIADGLIEPNDRLSSFERLECPYAKISAPFTISQFLLAFP